LHGSLPTTRFGGEEVAPPGGSAGGVGGGAGSSGVGGGAGSSGDGGGAGSLVEGLHAEIAKTNQAKESDKLERILMKLVLAHRRCSV